MAGTHVQARTADFQLDAMVAGKQLGRRALHAALALPHERLAVEVGDAAPEFASGCEVLVNERAGEGLGTSAALAARWAQGCDALLIMLADMPLVEPAFLARLAAGPGPAATLYPGGHAGVPACLPPAELPALSALGGEHGAAARLARIEGLVRIAPPPAMLRDVDSAEDLAQVARILGARAAI